MRNVIETWLSRCRLGHPDKINDRILLNGIFMHSLECQMHQRKDFFAGKGTGAYTSLHTWYIFGIIMMDVAPQKSCMFLLFMVHPPNVVVQEVSSDWLKFCNTSGNEHFLQHVWTVIFWHQETRPQWTKGLYLMAFSFSADFFFYA